MEFQEKNAFEIYWPLVDPKLSPLLTFLLRMYQCQLWFQFWMQLTYIFWKASFSAQPICYSAISAKSSNKQLWIRPKIAQLHFVKKENKKVFCCFQCTKLQQFLHDCALWKYWMYFHVISVVEFEIFGLFLIWNLWRIWRNWLGKKLFLLRFWIVHCIGPANVFFHYILKEEQNIAGITNSISFSSKVCSIKLCNRKNSRIVNLTFISGKKNGIWKNILHP